MTESNVIDRNHFLQNLQHSSDRQLFSAELYYHVIKLENDLAEREKTINDISSENRTLSKLLKVTEEELSKKRLDELNHHKKELESEQQIRGLEEQLKELTSRVFELQTENKQILQIQKSKISTLEKLTEQLNSFQNIEEYAESLRIELVQKNALLSQISEENKRLSKTIEQRDSTISELKSQDMGVPFKLWSEERRYLQAEIKNLQENKSLNEQSIARLQDRLKQLNERAINLSKNMNAASPNKNSTTKLKTNSSFSDSSTFDSSFSGENGQSVDIDLVPGILYEALKKTSKKQQKALSEKSLLLVEKDEAIEILERKLDNLIKTKDADFKQLKKKENEYKNQNSGLQSRIQFIEEEKRVKEQELKMEICNLKNKLRKEL